MSDLKVGDIVEHPTCMIRGRNCDEVGNVGVVKSINNCGDIFVSWIVSTSSSKGHFSMKDFTEGYLRRIET